MLWTIIFFGALLTVCLLLSVYKIRQLKNSIANVQTQLLDETEQKQNLNAELETLHNNLVINNLQDQLTGLPNRQVFEDRLTQALLQSKRYQLTFAVMFLDIDGFKIINDALGYDVGDVLLKEVAILLKDSIRQVDTVGRFAGDEFVFILPQLSKAQTSAYVAQRLLDIISQPFQIQDQELFITASIGIATFPVDGEDVQTILKNADIAMHQAKSRGRNNYQFYSEEMHALSRRELILSSSLRSASIYRDFTLLYMPQLNVETNKIVAMDVLLHWQHADFGLISLQDFFRLAENSGKILAIGEWMLRCALQQFKKWKSQGVYFNQIIVTVSLRQLEDTHFVYKVAQLLQEESLDPSCLILKISETMLLRKLELIEKALHMLKHLGIQIAIDEFGAGHLALQHLRHFPVDYLKIDRSLIQDISVNKDSQAIVQMIIALAKNLQIIVVADGVDSQNQKQLLTELGCRMMQGSLFGSTPRNAEEVVKETVL